MTPEPTKPRWKIIVVVLAIVVGFVVITARLDLIVAFMVKMLK